MNIVHTDLSQPMHIHVEPKGLCDCLPSIHLQVVVGAALVRYGRRCQYNDAAIVPIVVRAEDRDIQGAVLAREYSPVDDVVDGLDVDVIAHTERGFSLPSL